MSLLDYVRTHIKRRRLIPRRIAVLEVLAEPDNDNIPEELSAKAILRTIAEFYSTITNREGTLRQDIVEINKIIIDIGLQIRQRVDETQATKPNIYSLTWID